VEGYRNFIVQTSHPCLHEGMNRRDFLKLSALTTVPVLAGHAQPATGTKRSSKPFQLAEATISELQHAMESGRESAASLCKKYLDRIDELDRRGPKLRAVIELNPDAMAIARDLDRERKEKGPRTPMHGVPILIKDNIATHDRMTTTAGSLALEGSIAPGDAFVAKQLREAGAVILGKTNMTEWANFRGDRAISGWSGRGGQTRNPYVLDRNPSGSSSGSAVAVAANLCAVAVGTETNGSVISPANVCGIVGIKPTVGLVSRSHIIPISRTQDTAGPMARTVTDAAILLGAMVGADPKDDLTKAAADHIQRDYTKFLDPKGLKGKRIGIARQFFTTETMSDVLLASALKTMEEQGATLVPFTDKITNWGRAESVVLHYEFKAGVNDYLQWLGPKSRMRDLADLIDFNKRHADRELKYFGQEDFLHSQELGPLTDQAYLDALDKCQRASRDEGIDAVMKKYELDAIAAPGGGPADPIDPVYGDRGTGGCSGPAAIAGYPNIIVPAAQYMGLPVGLAFFGRAFSEPTLLAIAYAFEQATNVRREPQFLRSLAID
jgi:amidase